jgi:hypothetical protein
LLNKNPVIRNYNKERAKRRLLNTFFNFINAEKLINDANEKVNRFILKIRNCGIGFIF